MIAERRERERLEELQRQRDKEAEDRYSETDQERSAREREQKLSRAGYYELNGEKADRNRIL